MLVMFFPLIMYFNVYLQKYVFDVRGREGDIGLRLIVTLENRTSFFPFPCQNCFFVKASGQRKSGEGVTINTQLVSKWRYFIQSFQSTD